MERGMNERIRKLRKQSLETEPHIYMERADLETDAYMMYEGSVSVPELRALSFKHFMENKTLCINDGELIVGEKGDGTIFPGTLLSYSRRHEDHERQRSDLFPCFRGRSEIAGREDHPILGETFCSS